jgi:hypothetical protein
VVQNSNKGTKEDNDREHIDRKNESNWTVISRKLAKHKIDPSAGVTQERTRGVRRRIQGTISPGGEKGESPDSELNRERNNDGFPSNALPA